MIAMACENTLRILHAGKRVISCKLTSDGMQPKASSGKKRRRYSADDSQDTASFCSLQLSTQPITALSWSPLALTSARGCLLCAAVGHTCAIYARPSEPMQLHMEAVLQIAPLIHAALGHSQISAPTPKELEHSRVHSSSWSTLLRAPPSSTPAREGAPPGGACLLALAGRMHLTVLMVGFRAADMPVQCEHALSLPPKGGATAVRFAPRRGDLPEGAAEEMDLVSGHVDGSVHLWRLIVTASAFGRGGSGEGAAVQCTAAHVVKATPLLRQPIITLSVSVSPRVAAAGADEFAYAIVIGFGPFVQLHKVEARALRSQPPAQQLGDAPLVGQLQQQAAHAYDVTSVLCVADRWYSASHDGCVLHGTLVDLPSPPGGGGGNGGGGAAAAATDDVDDLDEEGAADTPQLLAYPVLDSFSPTSAFAVGSSELGKQLRFQPTPSGCPSSFKAAAGENGELRASAIQRLVFGLATPPTGGALAICLRTHFNDGTGSSSRLLTRPDNWRLLLATPPPFATPDAPVPSDLARLVARRPTGASLWAAAASLGARGQLEVCAAELKAMAHAAITSLAAEASTSPAGEVRTVQTARALAMELLGRPRSQPQVIAPSPAYAAGRTATSRKAAPDADAAAGVVGGAPTEAKRLLVSLADECAGALLRHQVATITPRPTAHAEACPLCAQPVQGDRTALACACANGHTLSRCWVCLELLPLEAWECGTCGAGACAKHTQLGQPHSHDPGVTACPLNATAPRGICGLCGSPCALPACLANRSAVADL